MANRLAGASRRDLKKKEHTEVELLDKEEGHVANAVELLVGEAPNRVLA